MNLTLAKITEEREGMEIGGRGGRKMNEKRSCYIYTENCIRAGKMVANETIEAHANPAECGDWWLWEGTLDDALRDIAIYDVRKKSYYWRIADTLRALWDIDEDEEDA